MGSSDAVPYPLTYSLSSLLLQRRTAMSTSSEFGPLPPRFAELKKEIAASIPDFEARATKAWGEILVELDKATKEIAAKGSAVRQFYDSSVKHPDSMVSSQNVPEVNFTELGTLSPERVKEIRDKGCLVIRDIVDDQEARTWQAWLRDYVSKNPVPGKLLARSRISQITALTLTGRLSYQVSRLTISNSSRCSEWH